MRKLTCHCEQVFNVDLPESVNLDTNPKIVADIASGAFLSCVCPSCNSVLHTDLKTRVEWPSKKATLTLIPEIDRLSYLSGSLSEGDGTTVVIGYAELADRVAVLASGLDPLAIEALKYHLAVKAQESSGGAKTSIYFERVTESGDVVFHIHGLKENEVAVMTIPASVYASVRADIKANPNDETYAALAHGNYLSYQNILIEGQGA